MGAGLKALQVPVPRCHCCPLTNFHCPLSEHSQKCPAEVTDMTLSFLTAKLGCCSSTVTAWQDGNPWTPRAIPLTDLPVVTELVALLLALMGADEELQVVLLEDLPCHVRAEVAATTSHCIHSAAFLGHGVTPENV